MTSRWCVDGRMVDERHVCVRMTAAAVTYGVEQVLLERQILSVGDLELDPISHSRFHGSLRGSFYHFGANVHSPYTATITFGKETGGHSSAAADIQYEGNFFDVTQPGKFLCPLQPAEVLGESDLGSEVKESLLVFHASTFLTLITIFPAADGSAPFWHNPYSREVLRLAGDLRRLFESPS